MLDKDDMKIYELNEDDIVEIHLMKIKGGKKE